MITVKEALEHVLGAIFPLGLEKEDILSALGRVVGEDIHAPRDIPPRDNSAMDGYALKSEDIAGAGAESSVILNVIEDIPAGYAPKKTVEFGEAARIMTGAPVPDGADAVVMVEETESDGNSVRIHAEAAKGQNIRYAGEDVREGNLVIRAGTLLRPAETGMLSALGRSFVKVYQKPLVALIATGDELVDIDGAASPGKIVNSNSYSLAAQVMECGGIPLQIGIARDNRNDLAEKFRDALRADVIVSSAGVSVGDYDFVKDVMEDIGINIEFWQVAERPGKPMTFGTREGKPVFGLPGNPVSSMITFEQYVRPAILKMTGHKNIFRRTIRAKLTEDINKKRGLRYFIRGRIKSQEGGFVVETTGEQGSGILKSMVLANGIIVIPEDVDFVKAGNEVMVQILDNSQDFTKDPEYLSD
ncbi:MAG: gephyrin-like molybdotransferase Glp [Thermodesulfobacteriota bacterium]|nr:gephyrin-like molybdotransferase Glp [Thermodesulfobacteriota bacterium]